MMGKKEEFYEEQLIGLNFYKDHEKRRSKEMAQHG